MRSALSLAFLGAIVVAIPNIAAASDPLGGAHVAYAIGGSVAQSNGGLRHGLDLALFPLLYSAKQSCPRDSFSSYSGYALGPTALIGFGKTSNYLGLDFGYGESSILGAFVGGGLVYRLPQDNMGRGYGAEGRLNVDFLLINAGLHLMALGGDHSSEVALTFSLGVGRF